MVSWYFSKGFHKHRWSHSTYVWVNTLRPRQNGRHFPDNILKWIFFCENVWIKVEISLKFVPKGHINNIPALVQIIAWRRPGNKPLSEPMMVSLLTHICVTQPEWVNSLWPSDAMTPSHYQKQCYPISVIFWLSPRVNFRESVLDMMGKVGLKLYFGIKATSTRGQWVNYFHISPIYAKKN